MKRVAGTTLGEAALKGLWIKRLPDIVQPVVAASTGQALEFTKVADSIVDAMATTQINRVEKRPVTEITELQAVVAELSRKFERFSTRGRSSARTRAFSRSISNNNNNNNNLPHSR